MDSLTERVLGAVFEVTNTLGAGFFEKVYQRALLRELGLRGIRAVAEASFTVTYKGHSAGEYFVDLLVEDVLGRGGVDTTWFVHPLSIHFLDTTLATFRRKNEGLNPVIS